ncbi:MAG: hypothetical protein KAV00_03535 [Phycisphaerae bacterium]|nr:hypothetical protein [Phycisphaerae bacterium]
MSESATTMRETLLKVRRLQKVEHKIRISRIDSPKRATLLAEGESLEAEINAVIDRIEEQIGTRDLGLGDKKMNQSEIKVLESSIGRSLTDDERSILTGSEAKHTLGPWSIDNNRAGIKNCIVADVQGTKQEIAFTTFPKVANWPTTIKTAEANARLIALAPTMRDTLLKVRRWRQVEHNLDEAVKDGRPELADLMRECPKLESEIDTVIDQIEEGCK